MKLTGYHHLTAITADAPGNFRYYTEILGLRLVKKTVNQDDTSAYHLFYADGKATPGTDITFFDWPAPPERRGTSSISRTGLRVPSADSLSYWSERLQRPIQNGIIEFEDPEGQRLSLHVDPNPESTPWSDSPVPPKHQISGLGPIQLTVPRRERTAKVLQSVLGMTSSANPEIFHFGTNAELHLKEDRQLQPARQGAGAVHHVAFRIPDADYDAWADRLATLGMPSSGPVDRFYFRSLYFREPNGILFEIATDGPGFTADEPLESLGKHLALPPFLEPQRAQIEAGLKPL